MKPNYLAFGAFGVVAVLATAMVASGGAQKLEQEVEALVGGWVQTLIAKTSAHEGTFWSVQRNLDGQGVSYGILQWTQKGGGLASVLGAMQAADPAKFAAIFGPGTDRMMAAVRSRSLAPVDGANLWDEPWLGRLRAAGKVPAFQHAQLKLASSSEYMQASIQIAQLLGVRTERAMVVYFNRAVHQGSAGALGPAKRLAEGWRLGKIRRPNNDRDVILQYAWMCAGIFRRTSPPSNASGWRLVGSEYPELAPGDRLPAKTPRVPVRQATWHRYAGNWPISLYDLIVYRTRDILNDPSLRDRPVDLSAVA